MISTFYIGNTYLDHFRNDLKDIRDHHFDNLVFPVSEADLLYRPDNIIELVTEAADSGFTTALSPASIGNLFGYGNPSILLNNAENRAISARGLIEDKVCPRSRDFQTVMYKLSDLAKKANVDWFLIDEPSLSFCYCDRCRSDINPMVDFLNGYIATVQSDNIEVSVCYWAGRIHPETYDIAQLVDDVGFSFPPEYLEDTAHFQIWANYVIGLAEKFNKTSSVWHQGYNIRSGMEEYLIDQVLLADEMGVNNHGSWIYRGGEGASYARCEDPVEMWRVAEVAFSKV